MKYDDDLLLRQLRQMQYPGTVDVVDSVMSRVRFLQPRQSAWHRWGRYVAGAAACILLLVSVNVFTFFMKDYNDPQIGSMLASVYSYDSYEFQSIEGYADMDYWSYYGEEE